MDQTRKTAVIVGFLLFGQIALQEMVFAFWLIFKGFDRTAVAV